MNTWYHARSSVRKWGGTEEDYMPIHQFIDSSKQVIGDVRHRSIYHHTLGTFLCEKIFGKTLQVTTKNGNTRDVPVREVAEQHVIEDLGWLPTPADYISGMPIHRWMSGAVKTERSLSTLGIKEVTK